MARRTPEVFCFICDTAPCSCGKPAKKTARPPTTPVIPTDRPVTPKRVGLSGLRMPVATPKPQPKVLNTDQTAGNEQLSRAITVLVEAGLVSDESIREHRKLVNLSDAEIRGIQWRERRRIRASTNASTDDD